MDNGEYAGGGNVPSYVLPLVQSQAWIRPHEHFERDRQGSVASI